MSAATACFVSRRTRSNRPASLTICPAPPPTAEARHEAPAVADLIESAVADCLERLSLIWRSRSRRAGVQLKAEANLRLYLAREVCGLTLAEAGRLADPPLDRSAARKACQRGQQIAELARTVPAPSRFNPDRPSVPTARRRGAAPSW